MNAQISVIPRHSGGRMQAAPKSAGNTPRGLTHHLDLGERGLAMEATRICSVGACERTVQARGLCNPHYKSAQKRDALPPREARDPMVTFWANVDRTPTCWLWTGYVTRYGYGAFAPRRGVTKRAHRVAWEAENGPVPAGLVLDHLCRVRHCVRPDHLEPVTDGENTRRGIGPTALNARKTKCSKGHPFTPENTRVVGDGRRSCWACTRAKWAARLERQRVGRDAQICSGTAERSGQRCRLTTTSPDGLCNHHSNQKAA